MQYTWGDVVTVKASAPARFRPGSTASVVALTLLETPKLAERLEVAMGTEVFTVEFGDGTAIEIPGDLLEAAGSRV